MNHAVNWEAISAIGQVVGAVAVVISLIYVAREVRRNTGATHLAAMRSMHDAYNHWIQLLAQYPDLNDLYNRGIHDLESLEGNDRGRFFVLMTGEFRNFEEIYHFRWERVEKSGEELVLNAAADARVFPVSVHAGYVRDLSYGNGIDIGLGTQFIINNRPDTLDRYYGDDLGYAFEFFLRIRPSLDGHATHQHDQHIAGMEK